MQEDLWFMKVEIHNFMSIKHAVIELEKENNTFVGSSNSGKTTVLRAIKWCLTNKPSGTYFITLGQQETAVKLWLSNGKTIERIKNRKTTNLYRLYQDDEVIGEYTGFGTSVPDDITEAHGITPISNNVYFQFADQLEGAFLLSMRPSQRADVLGDMDELKRIGKALSGINDDIRDNKARGKEQKAIRKSLKKDIEIIQANLDGSKHRIQVLKSLKEGLQSKLDLRKFLEIQMNRLKEVELVLTRIEDELLSTDRILKEWPLDMEERTEMARKIIIHTHRLSSIQSELSEIQFMSDDRLDKLDEVKVQIEKNLESFNKVKSHVQELVRNEELTERMKNSYSDKVAAIEPDETEKEIGKYRLLFKHIDRLRSIDQQVLIAEETVKSASQKIEDILIQFAEALQEAEICPTCGQETHGVCKNTLETLV